MLPLTIDDLYPEMPWALIDTVVFDVGNVLLSFDPPAILRDLAADVPEQWPRLMDRVFRSPYWVMIDHGTAPMEEIVDAMIGRETDLAPAIRRIMSGWIEMKETIPEGLQAVEACKAHGKRLLVLSNYGDEPFAHVEKKYAFFQQFDALAVSSRIGLMKPDPVMYRTVTERYGLTPERTLFIDDNPQNIEAALQAGWQGFCFSHPGKLSAFFAADRQKGTSV